MRAAFGTGVGSIELREVAQPAPRAGQVVVRVRACGICGSDLHWFQGGFPPPAVCPGHEIAGEVAALGHDVRAVREGDRVTVEPLIVCGRCAACQRGDYQLCGRFQLIGLAYDGGFADYVVVPARAIFPAPLNVDWDIAALTEPTAVCVHAARLAQLRIGERVLVLGAGTIGLLAVLVARVGGASTIAITARHPHQGNMARQLGATDVLDADAADIEAQAAALAPDLVVETVGGRADTINLAMHAVRAGGAVAVLGIFTTAPLLNALELVGKEVRLLGSLTYGRAGARADFEVATDLLAAERDRVQPLVTHRFDLDAVQQAFATAADKHSGAIKVTVLPA